MDDSASRLYLKLVYLFSSASVRKQPSNRRVKHIEDGACSIHERVGTKIGICSNVFRRLEQSNRKLGCGSKGTALHTGTWKSELVVGPFGSSVGLSSTRFRDLWRNRTRGLKSKFLRGIALAHHFKLRCWVSDTGRYALVYGINFMTDCGIYDHMIKTHCLFPQNTTSSEADAAFPVLSNLTVTYSDMDFKAIDSEKVTEKEKIDDGSCGGARVEDEDDDDDGFAERLASLQSSRLIIRGLRKAERASGQVDEEKEEEAEKEKTKKRKNTESNNRASCESKSRKKQGSNGEKRRTTKASEVERLNKKKTKKHSYSKNTKEAAETDYYRDSSKDGHAHFFELELEQEQHDIEKDVEYIEKRHSDASADNEGEEKSNPFVEDEAEEADDYEDEDTGDLAGEASGEKNPVRSKKDVSESQMEKFLKELFSKFQSGGTCEKYASFLQQQWEETIRKTNPMLRSVKYYTGERCETIMYCVLENTSAKAELAVKKKINDRFSTVSGAVKSGSVQHNYKSSELIDTVTIGDKLNQNKESPLLLLCILLVITELSLAEIVRDVFFHADEEEKEEEERVEEREYVSPKAKLVRRKGKPKEKTKKRRTRRIVDDDDEAENGDGTRSMQQTKMEEFLTPASKVDNE
jgi:hypothetical protein